MVFVPKVTEFFLDADICYLVGVIIGDGHISNSRRTLPPLTDVDPCISIEIGEKYFLSEVVKPLVEKVTLKSRKVIRRESRGPNRNPTWFLRFRSKYFHTFLTGALGLPAGKKARVVSLSKILRLVANDKVLLSELLAGIFDSDGGLRGKAIGQSTASVNLRDDVARALFLLGVPSVTKSEWINKKYGRTYFEWQIKRRSSILTFLRLVPLRNQIKKKRIFDRFFSAGVPERSNGQENQVVYST